MKSLFAHQAGLAFGLAIVVLIAAGLLAAENTLALVETYNKVANSQAVIANLGWIAADRADVAAAQQAYLRTRDSAHLLAAYGALQHMDDDLLELRNLTADNPAQQRRLDRLNNLLSPLRQMPSPGTDSQTAGAPAQVAAEDERTAVEIEVIITEIRDEEEYLAPIHMAAAKADARDTITMMGGAAVLALALVAAAALLSWRDSRKRRKQDAARQESRIRLDAIVGEAVNAIITLDPEQCIVVYNAAAERVLGYPAGEMIGKSVTRLLPERYRARPREWLAGLGRNPPPEPPVAIRADGSEIAVVASLSQTVVAGIKYTTLIWRDTAGGEAAPKTDITG